MSQEQNNTRGTLSIGEMREFASFTRAEDRYIKRSLDVARGRLDVEQFWGRTRQERVSIARQRVVYSVVPELKQLVKKNFDQPLKTLMPPLLEMTAFDLFAGALSSFSAFRFLYERLLGPGVRRWLPSAFCGAAAHPDLAPWRRKGLLQSISEMAATAPTWSQRVPFFFPEWIEKGE